MTSLPTITNAELVRLERSFHLMERDIRASLDRLNASLDAQARYTVTRRRSTRREVIVWIVLGVLAVASAAILLIGPQRVAAELRGGPAPDAYARYLSTAPANAPQLDENAALARATLGCGRSWPAGTVDAALQDAYVGVC